METLLTTALEREIEAAQGETISLLKALCAIPAPSHHEERRAEWIQAWLEKQGLSAAQANFLQIVQILLRKHLPYFSRQCTPNCLCLHWLVLPSFLILCGKGEKIPAMTLFHRARIL